MPMSPIEIRLAELAPLVRMTARQYAEQVVAYGDYSDDFYSEGLIAVWRVLQDNPDEGKGHLIGRMYWCMRGLVYSIRTPKPGGARGWTGKPRGVPYTRPVAPPASLDGMIAEGFEMPVGYAAPADAWIDEPSQRLDIEDPRLLEALSCLRPLTRETFLRYAAGDSIGKIADSMGHKYDSVAARITRARQYLAASLAVAA